MGGRWEHRPPIVRRERHDVGPGRARCVFGWEVGEARYVALTPKSAFGVGKGIGIVDGEVKPGRRIDVGAGALGIIGRWVLGLVAAWAADAHTRQARDTAKVLKLFFGDDPLSADALAEPALSAKNAHPLRRDS